MIPMILQAGLRHNLPQIEVMDEHAHMNAERRAVCRTGPLRSAQARCWRICASRDSWSAKRSTRLRIGKCDRCGTVVEPRLSTQWFIKIQPLADARDRSGGER